MEWLEISWESIKSSVIVKYSAAMKKNNCVDSTIISKIFVKF